MSDVPSIEELRKLSPATAASLAKIIEGAGKSRKEDQAIMQGLARDMRADMREIAADTMKSMVLLVEGLRQDVRDQNKRLQELEGECRDNDSRIGCLEGDVRLIKDDLGDLKRRFEVAKAGGVPA